MFIFALLALASSTLALQVDNFNETVRSSSPVTITWTSTAGDAHFSIELINQSFNRQFAIANNVDPTLNTLTLTLPAVPAA